jgi:hypothetical protein
MRRFLTLVFIVAALLSFGDITHAQDKTTQAAILQKLTDIDNRLNEMDKRYEVRFTKIETTLDERFNRIEDKFVAVNQRIDDKFNLMLGLLGLIAALLALPYVPKFFERFWVRLERKKDSQDLQKQIDQLKTQVAQLTQLIGRPTQ